MQSLRDFPGRKNAPANRRIFSIIFSNLKRQVSGAARNENEAHYFAAISNIDGEVGRICKAVEELGLTDNTVIFFSSDHGPAKLGKGKADRNYGTAAPYRGNKYGLWDGSIHVPGIVRWPAGIKAGTKISAVAGSIDWLPTICDISGTRVPSKVELDGHRVQPNPAVGRLL